MFAHVFSLLAYNLKFHDMRQPNSLMLIITNMDKKWAMVGRGYFAFILVALVVNNQYSFVCIHYVWYGLPVGF